MMSNSNSNSNSGSGSLESSEVASNTTKKVGGQSTLSDSLSADSGPSTISAPAISSSSESPPKKPKLVDINEEINCLKVTIENKNATLTSLTNKIIKLADDRRALRELPETIQIGQQLKDVVEDYSFLKTVREELVAAIAKDEAELSELRNPKEPVGAPVLAQGVGKTWLVLKNAQMSSDDFFLELPEPVLCMRDGKDVLTSILVSEDRVHVYNLILSSLRHSNVKILVTGTPGIGKSHLAYYVMWKLTQHPDFVKKRVFFQYDKDVLYELIEIGAKRSSKEELELSSNSLLFVDNISKSEPISCRNVQTIAFSSPDTTRYREFSKSLGFVELILNPPSKEDIKRIFDRNMYELSFYKDSHLSKEIFEKYSSVTSYDVVEENVNIIGCIPRYVFKSTAKCRELINSACYYKFSEIHKDLTVSGGAFAGMDVNFSFRLIHLESVDNMTRSYNFCSQYAILLLLSIKNGLKFTDVLSRLANDTPTAGNGYLFENLCHSMFILMVKGQKDTNTIKSFCSFTQDCRLLFKKGANSEIFKSESSELDVDGERRVVSGIFVFESKEEISSTNQSFKKNIYYLAAANHESFDAVTIIDDSVYFFQFTIGSKHEVSGFGLYDMIKSISATHGPKLKYHLIFVGIDESVSFRSFSSQKISLSKSIQAKNAKKYANDANIELSKPILAVPESEYVLLSLKPQALPEISQHILGLNVDRTLLDWGFNTDSHFSRP